MILRIHVTHSSDVEKQLSAINLQIQKVNEELSVLRGMIDNIQPLSICLSDENVPPET